MLRDVLLPFDCLWLSFPQAIAIRNVIIMKKNKKNIDYMKIVSIIILLAYIISPVDFLPLVELDDGLAGIIIGKLLE